MLKIGAIIQGKKILLPPLYAGNDGSIIDHSDNTLIVFSCNKDDTGAIIRRSLQGIHFEVGEDREIRSTKVRFEAEIKENESLELKFTSMMGRSILLFQHSVTVKH